MISLDKEYRTRGGRKVRLLCVDGPDERYPIVGITEGLLSANKWSSDGVYLLDHIHEFDLIESKPRVKKTVWINVHNDGGMTLWCCEDKAKKHFPETQIARTKHEIDVEHGHGLGDANE